jgi:exodeoxyribonuclease V beta subunit
VNEIRDFNLLKSPLEGTNLIEASAGTGKTYAITGLVLRLILEKAIPIEEVLVVTFTEAATSELKDRIRKRLREALEMFSGSGAQDELLEGLYASHPNAAAASRRLKRAINDFDRASIFTIHGFCMRVLHDHAFESGMLFDTELVTDQEILIREIVHDFWRKHFYNASILFFNYAAAHGLNPGSLRSMVGRHTTNPYLKIIPESGVPGCSELEAEFLVRFEKCRQAWTSAKPEVQVILTTSETLNRAKYRKDRIAGWLQAMEAYLSGECFDCSLFDRFEKFTTIHMKSAVKKGAEPPSHPFFLLCDQLNLAQQRLAEGFDRCLLGLKLEFIHTVRSELAKRKLDKNIVFYDDLLLMLDRALRGPGGEDLAAIAGSKFKAALIDEFQDTDSIQYAIFENIFGQAGSPLFLIGDPKQAIYGFRGADIFTYMDAARSASNRFTLGENWRSEPALISAVNTVFSRATVPFVYEDIGFEPVRPAGNKRHEMLELDGEKKPPLQIWFLKADGIKGEQPITRAIARDVIPQAVAAEISRLLALAREGKAVIDRRSIQAGDIAVLVRRNAEAGLVKEALSSLGIHSVLYDIGNLFETHEAMEVERLLTSIADPSDERLLKAALLTDMLGLGGEGLDRLIRDEPEWDEWLSRIGEYHDTWSRHGFFRMFRHLLLREAVLPRLMALVDGERRCTNVLHLSEMLHGAAIEGSLSMHGLVKWLSEQRAEDTPKLEEHQLRLESDENAVKLVTIHKSKGLEYPIVFCPFIGDRSRVLQGDGPFTFHDELDGRRLTLDLGSPGREENLKLAEKEQLAENVRLLYVAMTRARHRCTLVWGCFRDAESSAPAYLFHQPGSEEAGNLPEAVCSRYSSSNEQELWNDLEAIQREGQGSIELLEAPLEKGQPQPGLEEERVELGCRSFSGRIHRDWGISSFSSIVSNQPRKAEWADRDDMIRPGLAEEEDLQGTLPPTGEFRDILSFPRGAAAGIFLHEVFEHLDFTSRDRTLIEELVTDKLKMHGFESFWTGAVCDMVRKVLAVPLESGPDSFTLSQVQAADRLNELEFYFPLEVTGEHSLKELLGRTAGTTKHEDSPFRKRGNAGELETPILPSLDGNAAELKTKKLPSLDGRGWGRVETGDVPHPHPTSPVKGEELNSAPFRKRGKGGFAASPSTLEQLKFKPLEGYMKGFIDLVFRHRGRFYIVDWKSNYLGARTEDYDQAAMLAAMDENLYHLQVHLYAIAVHAYLKTRIPEYAYESHFGGVYYIFLRGVDPAKGREYGVYRNRPPAAFIETLCFHLRG